MKPLFLAALGMFAAPLVVVDAGHATPCAPGADCSNPRAEDTMVPGSDVYGPGTLGIDTLVGDVGQTVTVTVPIITNSRIDAFTIDLMYPTELVTLEDVSPGDLVQDFYGFLWSGFPGGVRFGGYGGNAYVASGESGTLAVLTFHVDAPGCRSFCFLNLLDNLDAYSACAMCSAEPPDPEPTTPMSWGMLKSSYR